jgi:uncharacterized membrane protein YphA (DoxX/SURF4 family)
MSILRNDAVALLVRLLVGGVFVYASLDKIMHPAGFAKAVNNYHILPNDLISIFALILPWLELLCGMALIMGTKVSGAALILLGMNFMFVIAIASALVRGLNIDCGCFSTSTRARTIGLTTLLLDIGLVVLIFYTVRFGAGRWSLDRRTVAA